MPDALTLTVRECVSPTSTMRRLVLDLGDVPFVYDAGQAAAIGLHGQRERRPYSIASAPSDTRATGTIEFLLRETPGAGVGRHLDAATAGSRVDFEGPFGAFVLPTPLPDAPLLFVAGGTGIAPLRALAREARARGHRAPRHLVYSVRESDDVAFADELRRWRDDHGGEAIVTVTRQRAEAGQRQGRIDRGTLEPFARMQPWCFVCGPPSMVDDLALLLSQVGVAGERLRTEQWSGTA